MGQLIKLFSFNNVDKKSEIELIKEKVQFLKGLFSEVNPELDIDKLYAEFQELQNIMNEGEGSKFDKQIDRELNNYR